MQKTVIESKMNISKNLGHRLNLNRVANQETNLNIQSRRTVLQVGSVNKGWIVLIEPIDQVGQFTDSTNFLNGQNVRRFENSSNVH